MPLGAVWSINLCISTLWPSRTGCPIPGRTSPFLHLLLLQRNGSWLSARYTTLFLTFASPSRQAISPGSQLELLGPLRSCGYPFHAHVGILSWKPGRFPTDSSSGMGRALSASNFLPLFPMSLCCLLAPRRGCQYQHYPQRCKPSSIKCANVVNSIP